MSSLTETFLTFFQFLVLLYIFTAHCTLFNAFCTFSIASSLLSPVVSISSSLSPAPPLAPPAPAGFAATDLGAVAAAGFAGGF